jgi:hypothetical protein
VIEEDNGEEWVLVQTPRVDDDRDCWYPPKKPAASGGEGGEDAGETDPEDWILAWIADVAAGRDPVVGPTSTAHGSRIKSGMTGSSFVIPAKAADAAASRDPVAGFSTDAGEPGKRSAERRAEDSGQPCPAERSAERTEPPPGSAGPNTRSPLMDRDLFNHLQDIRRESPDKLRADALGVLAEAALGNGLGNRLRGEPYQVVLHVDAGLLAGTAEEGRCELEGGAGVSVETCRRLACDGAVRVVTHGKGGAVEDVGRRSRKIPLALWRVLQERDRHCRFPGCHRTEKLHGHHIVHWAHGGATSQNNVVSLCGGCHWKVHEGGYRVVGDASGELTFLRPDGSVIPGIPASPPVPADPMGALMEQNRAAGITITPETNHVGWGGEPLDLVWIVEGLLQAEAEYKRAQGG